jgi:hypothetical protein
MARVVNERGGAGDVLLNYFVDCTHFIAGGITLSVALL